MPISLFVTNQYLPLVELKLALQKQGNAIVLVTSHHLYPSEINYLKQGCGFDFEYAPMDSFFSESDLSCIDDSIWKELEPQWRGTGLPLWNECHKKRISAKSSHLSRRLQAAYAPSACFVTPGLGLDPEGFSKHLSVRILSPRDPQGHSKPGLRKRIVARLNSFAPTETYQVSCAGQKMSFIGNPSRVTSRITNWEFSPKSFFSPGRYLPYLRRHVLTDYLLTPMHQYSPLQYFPIHILQDGHLPSSYTSTLFFSFRPMDILVSSNPFSFKWAKKANFPVASLPGFCDPEMTIPLKSSKISNIFVPLGHAGDWSAQIQRSDTDRMVLAVVEMAKLYPMLEFRLRPHPTMTHILHEGLNSHDRIIRIVNEYNIPNLKLSSKSTISSDLEWADLVLSEYSQVLIEAWTKGILGISYNPTCRMSFIQDYNDLGFPFISNIHDISNIIDKLDSFREHQANAVSLFNKTLNNWNPFPTN